MIDFELTDEQRLIRETAAEFVDREIIPKARDNDRNEHFDLDWAAKMGEIGFLGAIVSEEYGGRGVDYRTYGLIVEEIGRGDSSARTIVSVQTSLVCSSIERWGTEEQKQEWLPKLCSGEALGCFGLTEPDTGSDAANLKTRAEKVDGGWKISGQKQWISLGNHAKLALIFAQTDPSLKHKGLACFMVPTESEGFSSSEIHGKLGLHASDTAELALDGVEVPDEAMLGEVGEGFKVAMSALDSGRFSVAVRLRRHLPGLRERVGRLRQAAGAVRQADRLVPARAGDDRRHGRQDRGGAGPGLARRLAQGHRPARTRSRPPWPSCSPRSPRSSAPTPRSRCTAARGTSTTTRWSATCATRA